MNKISLTLVTTSIISLLFMSRGFAEAVSFSSPTSRTILIELFTSEGCSSCPPAEKYLNSYTDKPMLWTKYIPLAFHVDYWDYLGWKDEFAKPQFSQRQRRYAKINRERTVYTPGFFVNGRPWRPGFFRYSDPEITPQEIGTLELRIDHKQVQASFDPLHKDGKNYILNFALLGMKHISRIEAGENEGRTSRHEFVVHTLNQYTANKDNQWHFNLAQVTIPNGKPLAFAAWIATTNSPVPLQATGGYLPDSLSRLLIP